VSIEITVDSKCNTKKVLLLGSSHGRGLHERLHSIVGDEYMVTNIFKPNATLGNVVGELK
jgi:trans-2-enoyl-CoA reductase